MIPKWMQYVIFAAAVTYLRETFSKAVREWQAERDEMKRFDARLREAEQEEGDLESRRAAYAFQKSTECIDAGGSLEAASVVY